MSEGSKIRSQITEIAISIEFTGAKNTYQTKQLAEAGLHINVRYVVYARGSSLAAPQGTIGYRIPQNNIL